MFTLPTSHDIAADSISSYRELDTPTFHTSFRVLTAKIWRPQAIVEVVHEIGPRMVDGQGEGQGHDYHYQRPKLVRIKRV